MRTFLTSSGLPSISSPFSSVPHTLASISHLYADSPNYFCFLSPLVSFF
uniref:Uncharacterized protein n=1 Tax=Anguilla anguilla TaxID=7936 RepID=A0A0E9PBA3_ANGAN